MKKRRARGIRGDPPLQDEPTDPLHTETVEFSVSYAAEKSMPFVRGKSENRPFGVTAVADADLTIG
jgi:hypothetical protein